MNCGDQGTQRLSGCVSEMVIEGGKGALKSWSIPGWFLFVSRQRVMLQRSRKHVELKNGAICQLSKILYVTYLWGTHRELAPKITITRSVNSLLPHNLLFVPQTRGEN